MKSMLNSPTAIVFIVLLLGCIGCESSTTVDQETIRAALRERVQAGMTRTQVEVLLGKGEPPSEMEAKVLKIGMTKPSDPSMAPNGYQADDSFCSYTLDGIKVFLQFREDKLINFNPQLY